MFAVTNLRKKAHSLFSIPTHSLGFGNFTMIIKMKMYSEILTEQHFTAETNSAEHFLLTYSSVSAFRLQSIKRTNLIAIIFSHLTLISL